MIEVRYVRTAGGHGRFEAARRAYAAGLGASEWEAFLWPEARAALAAAKGGVK